VIQHSLLIPFTVGALLPGSFKQVIDFATPGIMAALHQHNDCIANNAADFIIVIIIQCITFHRFSSGCDSHLKRLDRKWLARKRSAINSQK